MLYDDERLPEQNIFNKIASEFKEKFNSEKKLAEAGSTDLKEQEAKTLLIKVYTLLFENEIFLNQLKNVLKKSKYRVSTFASNLDNAILKTQEHKKIFEKLNIGLEKDINVEDKKMKFYNAKTSIMYFCNNQMDLLKSLLWLMLIKNMWCGCRDINKIATEQVEILNSVLKLL